MDRWRLILTCEHASNRLPDWAESLFAGAETDLNSHRGWDPGAAELAGRLAEHFNAHLWCGEYSRLLIELNRSPDSKSLFSPWTRHLPEAERSRLMEELYRPFRQQVVEAIERIITAGERVLHLSIHSFTPVWKGEERTVDLGILFDPRRSGEAAVATALRASLVKTLPSLRVRCNRPYRGTSDGHTTALRGRFPQETYAGIELEVSQGLVAAGAQQWQQVQGGIVSAIADSRLLPPL